MATHYTKKMQTGEQGIAYIQYIASKAGFIYRPFEKADIGVDGAIELINEKREPSGDFILVQVKSGLSFVRGSKYYLKADKDHFETWSRYSIPVVGIIHNPNAEDARWVNISEHLKKNPEQIVTVLTRLKHRKTKNLLLLPSIIFKKNISSPILYQHPLIFLFVLGKGKMPDLRALC